MALAALVGVSAPYAACCSARIAATSASSAAFAFTYASGIGPGPSGVFSAAHSAAATRGRLTVTEARPPQALCARPLSDRS
jgi:hypothetical protein